MPDVTSTATTDLARGGCQPNVVYNTEATTGERYILTPHEPTPRTEP